MDIIFLRIVIVRFLYIVGLFIWFPVHGADTENPPREDQLRLKSDNLQPSYSLNFASVYLAQWAFYFVSQKEIIEETGSFENWVKYPTQTHFDHDSYDYNIVKHSLAGNYYYLFYRSRGYEKQESFLWAFASSLAFEFTIETVTEPPSFQDIYQTPIYGTLVGFGSEYISEQLLASRYQLLNFLGYVFNPFALFEENSSSVVTMPYIRKGEFGGYLSFEY